MTMCPNLLEGKVLITSSLPHFLECPVLTKITKLVLQVQALGDEIKQVKEDGNDQMIRIGERITTKCEQRIDVNSTAIRRVNETITDTIQSQFDRISKRFETIDAVRDGDRMEQMKNKVEVVKIESLRQALFDKIVREVRAMEQQLRQTKTTR
jgi:hypothetical protein